MKPEPAKILDLAAYRERSHARRRTHVDDMADYLRGRADEYQKQNWHLFAHMLRQEADQLLASADE